VDDAFYAPAGTGYEASRYTRGPWDPGFQHAGPPSALLAREAGRVSGLPDGNFARLTFDILRPVPIARIHVEARVVRPGRRVEQIEGVLHAGDDDPLMRMTAWRIRDEREELPDHLRAEPPPPGPDGLPVPEFPFFDGEVAYDKSLDWRLISGSIADVGPAAVWTRLRVPLVAGEEPAPLERLLVMADAASGVSATLDWERFTFLNVDFGVHLERPPEGEWMAMDAVTRPGPHGAGQCLATLSDARGRLGVSTQSLLIASR
jgi:hypothetical protein